MQLHQLKRREFITLLGGAAAAWPLPLSAEQRERMRRIGVLMLYPENDPAGQLRAKAFRQGLEKLGGAAGRGVQIAFHLGVGDPAWLPSRAPPVLPGGPDVSPG